MVSLGNLNPYFTKIQIDSATRVLLMNLKLLHELKIRDRFLKIEAVNEFTKKAYQGFGITINIIIRRTEDPGQTTHRVRGQPDKI